MKSSSRFNWLPHAVPFVGLVVLGSAWGRSLPAVLAVGVAAMLVAAVLASVVHAEAIAHQVGEPLGTLVLALAVTVIEVSLIVTLMIADPAKNASLARDTVFGAIMIATNGIIGASLIASARRSEIVIFSGEGAQALFATVITLTTLSMVMPTFTSSSEGPTFNGAQLGFSAIASAVVYGVFVFVQNVRHQWMFIEPDSEDTVDVGAPPLPSAPGSAHLRSTFQRGGLLLVSLVAVVGLAKTLAPSIERAVAFAGAPHSFVGVVIALLVLLPEAIAALRAARRNEMQTSINLALGSGLASIGLTIPAIAVSSIWLDGPIVLGLGSKEIVFLSLTAVLGTLTLVPGRATVLQGTHHLAVFAAFIFLAAVP